ncbi:MAG: TonB family protein [Pyrinomonadaceae bacterium]
MLFVLLASVLCQAQAAASRTCDFSEYKTTGLSHFVPNAIVEAAKPAYPPAARAVQAQGKVRVKILVDRRGRVRETCVLEGHPLLRAAAVRAARETLFKPNFGVSRSFAKGKRFLTDELVYNFTLE